MSTSGPAAPGTVALLPLAAPRPWHAFLVEMSAFPAPLYELRPVHRTIEALVSRVAARRRLTRQVFVQVQQIARGGDAAERIGTHAARWLPQLGMGVWPDRPAPYTRTMKDFEHLGAGEMPEVIFFQVLHVTGPAEARAHCVETMMGLGTTVQILAAEEEAAYLARIGPVLSAPITERSFQQFPLYAPLLEARSVAGAGSADLGRWLGGAALYVRESREDGGVLLLADGPLDDDLVALGGRRERTPDSHHWLLTEEALP